MKNIDSLQTYLVGGSVRDKILGIESPDRDWVVVGSSPKAMLDLGFRSVGKDFPVFLHPTTAEEYALARTERKSGKGYQGFAFYTNPDVTLEQDLLRRDLTINAIAEDSSGQLIDPYNGQRDIKNKILRHVSPAFAEDPLRIFRVARFAARFSELGFSIADETLQLMQQIVKQDEVKHLSPERIWQETAKALMTPHPDIYISVLRQCGALQKYLPEVDGLFGVPQPEAHHPEIDTGEHILLCLRQSAALHHSLPVRFAVLLHDVGKGLTPKEKWPKHIAHEHLGIKPVKKICARLKIPNECRDAALLLTQYHLHIHRALELKPATVLKVLAAADAFRRPERLHQLLQGSEADAKGRLTLENHPYPQKDFLLEAFNKAKKIDIAALTTQGLKDKALGEAITQERTKAIAEVKKHWQKNKKEDNND